ncbi:aminotransferase class IV [Hymenobacter jejuensis]|uniref:branched-chain-amino-acid transaminase n=1 Tax=Hymenobacter jejuensis TaxID=2502781 RepID=A0A5B7ZZC5_9BACT|nr:aminotransferase class IV [Hymenobacter jejuensis]QDA60574.1 amino acid aminotransferase [Hymenobacter jejuensis]
MADPADLFAYVRGEIVPLDRAFLHVSDLAIQRGYGVFDFFKVVDGQPLFLEQHLDRFEASAQQMELAVPLSRAALESAIRELITRHDLPVSGVKVLLTGGYSTDGYTPAEANLVMLQQPFAFPTPAQVAQGISIISHDYVREMPPVKTINYTMGIRLIKELKAHGADDVLYHKNGLVTEFPRSNFFIVKHDNTVVTPAQDVLWGITRQNLLGLSGTPYRIMEAPVNLQDVREAKEAFLTSTTKRVLPVVQLDGAPIGSGKPGAVTLALLDALVELEERQLKTLLEKQ